MLLKPGWKSTWISNLQLKTTKNIVCPTLQCFLDLGFSVYGGSNAPYVWVGFPGKASWWVWLHSWFRLPEYF